MTERREADPGRPLRRPRRIAIYRHALMTRLTHWINLLCVVVLLMSGADFQRASGSLLGASGGAKYVMRIELTDRLDRIGRGKGGFWEDRGYEWYAGILNPVAGMRDHARLNMPRSGFNSVCLSASRSPLARSQSVDDDVEAIWLYLRFTLSFRDVEDLLAERGILVSYETVRRWVNHFGPKIAADLRRRRSKPHTI